ncbi:MAG: phosphoadenylyl-sulfate reductase [Odoribacteraceae bacterium]|jgi:phosphoadenosine phosphosulfate reductase|nr:phosphoadenylyl-sulfate reductase [Odoribacteraceae bacterium]
MDLILTRMKTALDIEKINEQHATTGVEEFLRYILDTFGDRVALASSLGLEDQLLTDLVLRLRPGTRVFTLDTGRLFPETYRLIDRTNKRYGIKIDLFFPDHALVQEMVRAEGINLFYDSVEKRQRCCQTRKLEPLRRAFTGLEAWICGLRREQSVTRQETRRVERDEANGLYKFNPLINWSEEEVRAYIVEHEVPYNTLHDAGYPSIGCEPCTRAVAPGEDPRAGRWWWESPLHKECGLHRR